MPISNRHWKDNERPMSGTVLRKERDMDEKRFSRPVGLRQIQITDEFWRREQELVRTEVIPYQWEALNDRVSGAAPSYCMHNFRAAGRLVGEKKRAGGGFTAPAYTYRGFEVLPEDPAHPDPDAFYGFVFQDTDFSKWIEAVAYTLTWHPDPRLEQIADEAIDVVCAAQWENGYLDTYYILNGMDRAFTNLKDHHELYCLGHLTEGAVAYYQATGKDRLLKAACRFADYAASVFGPEEGKCKGYPGHEIAEMALVRLYEVTGCERYLRLAEFFLNQRGTEPHYFIEEEKRRWLYEHGKETGRKGGEPAASGSAASGSAASDSSAADSAAAGGAPETAAREFPPRIRALTAADYAYYQADRPVRAQAEAKGHAVRAGYLYSGMADIARLSGDEAMYAACRRLWDNIVKEKLYITGGVGGTRDGEAFSYPYDLPNDAAYSETCAAIALVFFARRMLQIRPESSYADVMELALYNTVLAGMALDGKSFFYVNPLEAVPEACRRDSRLSHVKPVRQKWFGCACCPPNLARLISSLGAYAYTENEDTLWFHLYLGGRVTKEVRLGQRPAAGEDAQGVWGETMSGKLREDSLHSGQESARPRAARITLRMETEMPWAGKVQVHVCEAEPAASGAGSEPCGAPGTEDGGIGCTLAFRIPGWCRGYRAEVIRGGQRQEICRPEAGYAEPTAWVEDGYLYIGGPWRSGDTILLDFPMEVRVKAANPRVREDVGKVAVTRGPITYCAEEADNGSGLHLYRVDLEKAASIRTETSVSLGHPMEILRVPAKKMTAAAAALYSDYMPPEEEDTELTLIPYYAWANRGEGEMAVWLRG